MRRIVGRVAAGRLGALGHLAEQLLVQRRVLAARADEAVADAAGQLGRQRAGRGHVDRDRLVGPVVDRRVGGAVPLALEVHALLRPEQADQLDRLGQPHPALLAPGELLAGRGRLVERLAGPDAEEHAPGREAAERPERLGDHRRVVAKRRREHARAEHRALGGDRGSAQPGQRRRRVSAVVAPGLEVVGDGHDLEADALGAAARSSSSSTGAELLRGGLVAELHAAAING